jgi:hypothetical protein
MTVWEVLAAIGAVTGVPALIWQIYAQIHTWRASAPNIHVTVANALPVGPTGVGGHHFSLTAVNHGGALTTINMWGLRLPNEGDLVLIQQLPFSDRLPAPVAPQASVTFYIEAQDVFDRCAQQGVKASQLRPWVRLATGREVFGKNLPWKG